ncbi:MAG TPA: putative molybdenum carrier protein [Planctomycetota bacterium]
MLEEVPRAGDLLLVSGGQTGADRAALEFAVRRGIAHGGWCPRGRLAEDGVIPARFRLRETESADYVDRTRRNVVDADGTLIVSLAAPLEGGTAMTAKFAADAGRPLLVLAGENDLDADAALLRSFLAGHAVRRLNVAGPRASKQPGVFARVRRLLALALPPERDGHVAIWLLPEAAERPELAAAIAALAARHPPAAPFPPHLTVASFDLPLCNLEAPLAAVAARAPRPVLEVDGLGAEDSLAHSLFLRMHGGTDLPAIAAAVQRAFGPAAGAPPAPHLSLLYAPLDLAERAAELDACAGIASGAIRFTHLQAVRIGNPFTWPEQVTGWPRLTSELPIPS